MIKCPNGTRIQQDCSMQQTNQQRFNLHIIVIFMMECFGALNSRGFSSQIEYGQLPEPSHLTYEGIFNEIQFDVGAVPQLPLDLQIGYARYQFLESIHDKDINDYLALFVKGNRDGKDRDDRSMNATMCLDISGSMGGSLGLGNNGRSRLSLSVEAIRMFISKLRPNDSFGLVTFQNDAKVIIQQTRISNLNMEQTFAKLNKIKTGGGTTIRCGFEQSQNMLYQYVLQNECVNCENRIIMLTDVCDNSIANQRLFLEKASAQTGTTLTIVGISDQFRSEVCQQLKNVKGFNYFCAVDQDDIKKYVFQNFNFSYFPSAFNLNIQIESEDIKQFEVYGSTDAADVPTYNANFESKKSKWVISKMKSSFPSEIKIVNGRVHNYGGLILIKLSRRSKNPFFKGRITLDYEDPSGKAHSQQYQVNYEFHPEEQFLSDETLRSALQGFTFVSQLRTLLAENKNAIAPQKIYEKYWPMIQTIEKLVPESKKKDLQSIKDILQKYGEDKQEVKSFEFNPYNMM